MTGPGCWAGRRAAGSRISPGQSGLTILRRMIPFLHLGPVEIPTFGLMVAAAMLAAFYVLRGDMARRGFVAHLSPEGVSPDMRVTAAGIDWQSEGENIAFYRGVAAAQTAFMNEPRFAANHRANILDPKFTEVGIGIVEGPGGRYYITQEFIERLRTGASPSLTPVPLQRAPPTQTGSEPAASPPSTCVSRSDYPCSRRAAAVFKRLSRNVR